MQDYVDKGRIAGIATVITRGGKLVHFETYGKMDVERNLPMRKDVDPAHGVDVEGRDDRRRWRSCSKRAGCC